MLASGHNIDDILGMSWEQIKICSRSILRHKISMLNMILEPISNSLGSKYNKGKMKKKPKSTQTREQKDKERLHKLKKLGFLS
ncbi:MAG: hypothetical protein ACR2M6_02570 [Vampirovibrionia bacterium]